MRRFGGFVRSTLEASVAAGRVDLAREERMGRCREAHRVRGEEKMAGPEGGSMIFLLGILLNLYGTYV